MKIWVCREILFWFVLDWELSEPFLSAFHSCQVGISFKSWTGSFAPECRPSGTHSALGTAALGSNFIKQSSSRFSRAAEAFPELRRRRVFDPTDRWEFSFGYRSPQFPSFPKKILMLSSVFSMLYDCTNQALDWEHLVAVSPFSLCKGFPQGPWDNLASCTDTCK